MRKLPTRKLLTALIAGALFIPNTGFTLGLGEIEVNSALNQRLNADIELLSTTPEDAESIIIKLASRKEFLRAGLDRPYLLNDLRFKSEIVDGVAHIKVSSGSPIREPFINFLIEIDWPNGHLLREYTVLLDPPVFMTQAASTESFQSADNSNFRPAANASTNVTPVVVPAVTAPSRPAMQSAPAAKTQSSATNAASTTSSAPTFIPAPVVQQQTPTTQQATSYRVKSGDTAWKLADAMRPNQNISVPQMLMAMLRTNPESFINGNINGLKRGYILRAPDAAQIAAISQEDARAMVREHWALWRQYQQSKAGVQSASAMPADDRPASTGTAEDSTANDTLTKNEAHLAIVAGGGTGASTVGGKDPAKMSAQELRAELALARERVETERVEKEELKQRVDSLEQRAAKMKGMLSIEDNELADVQSLNSSVEDNAVNTNDSGEMGEDVLSETNINAITEESAESEVMSAESTAEDSAVATEELTDAASTEDAIFTDEISAQVADTNPLNESAAATPENTAPVMDDASSEPAADPLTQLLNNPTLLAAAGGGLLLIVALIALINKRRKAGMDSEVYSAPVMNSGDDLESLADDIAEETAMEEVNYEASADEQAGADEVPDGAEETVAAQAETDAPAEEEPRDDVIAEADVYLAYGIYQQAEDLLKQALLEHPENDNYRAKLAETYYTSKNADAFLVIASELQQRVDDDSPIWNKVSVMGQDLCANDPMFQGEMVGDLDLDATSADELSLEFGSDDDVVDDSAQNAEDETPDAPVDEIEFDLSDTGAVEEVEAASEDEFSLDIDASELDIDIQDEATNEANMEEEGFDLSDIDISLDEEDAPVSADSENDENQETSDIDIDFGLDDTVEDVKIEEDISLDLLDDSEEADAEEVSLDLSEEMEAEAVELDITEDAADAVIAANDDSAEDGDFDLSSLDDVDEISTKLDLARAYLDMGDHDGTRDILDEVLADGNDEQKQEASDLMEKLG